MMNNFRLTYLLILTLEYWLKAACMSSFMNLQKYFRHNTTFNQFKLTKAKDCDWMTRYLLCRDYIFHQMTNQTNYVRQNKNALK